VRQAEGPFSTYAPILGLDRARSGKGHEDAFPPPRLSGRCRFSQGTFAGTRRNGEDAPIPDARRSGDR
jgi:hypothetical protein